MSTHTLARTHSRTLPLIYALALLYTQSEINLRQWVTKVKLNYSEFSDDPDDDIHNVHVYRVR